MADMAAIIVPMIWADGAMFQRQCIAWADIESGTCPSGTDKPPRKATFIATLRGETEVDRAAIGLSSPSRTDRKEKRYGRLWPDKPSTDSHPVIPPAPKGDNRPGGRVPARPSVPRIRALNIIPSELCNSRRHRQYPAPAESNINGSEARKNGLQGV